MSTRELFCPDPCDKGCALAPADESTSFPGFSFLLREKTLVAAGHVEMCVNKMRSGGRSSNKFCRLDDEIPPGVGRKFLLQNGA